MLKTNNPFCSLFLIAMTALVSCDEPPQNESVRIEIGDCIEQTIGTSTEYDQCAEVEKLPMYNELRACFVWQSGRFIGSSTLRHRAGWQIDENQPQVGEFSVNDFGGASLFLGGPTLQCAALLPGMDCEDIDDCLLVLTDAFVLRGDPDRLTFADETGTCAVADNFTETLRACLDAFDAFGASDRDGTIDTDLGGLADATIQLDATAVDARTQDASVDIDRSVFRCGNNETTSEPICMPGQTESCGNCGQRTCSDACEWGECGAEGVCTVADTREVSCGQCGKKTQTCTETCEWVDSSDCGLEGPCEPEATRMKPCGLCGFVVQLCTASCEWEDQTDCELQGDCAPGTTQNCGECGMQTCSESCRWQGCEGDGSRWRSCNDCGWQFCLSNGDYSTDCTAKSDPNCPPTAPFCTVIGMCISIF